VICTVTNALTEPVHVMYHNAGHTYHTHEVTDTLSVYFMFITLSLLWLLLSFTLHALNQSNYINAGLNALSGKYEDSCF
jgi:hypothetical protein